MEKGFGFARCSMTTSAVIHGLPESFYCDSIVDGWGPETVRPLPTQPPDDAYRRKIFSIHRCHSIPLKTPTPALVH